jgi:hypothetical protein
MPMRARAYVCTCAGHADLAGCAGCTRQRMEHDQHDASHDSAYNGRPRSRYVMCARRSSPNSCASSAHGAPGFPLAERRATRLAVHDRHRAYSTQLGRTQRTTCDGPYVLSPASGALLASTHALPVPYCACRSSARARARGCELCSAKRTRLSESLKYGLGATRGHARAHARFRRVGSERRYALKRRAQGVCALSRRAQGVCARLPTNNRTALSSLLPYLVP